MADFYVSWDDYHRDIEKLAIQIYESGWEFNQIVCLAKGGLRVGDTLCRLFDAPWLFCLRPPTAAAMAAHGGTSPFPATSA